MIQSYFKIGWRNLAHQKGYSFINISGLAVGMAVTILIGLWVYDEFSFNKYHRNYNRIGRIIRNGTLNGVTSSSTYQPYALADELRTKYGTHFKNVVISWTQGDHVLSNGDDKFVKGGRFVEPVFPEMLSLKMLKGSLSGLNDPHSILLSASLAKTIFGADDPLDKALKIDNAMDVKVTGIYEDLPHNSDFHAATFLAPWQLYVLNNSWINSQGFGNNFLDVYVELLHSGDFENVSTQVKDAILNNIQDHKDYVAVNPQIFVHPMNKWHLYSEFKNGKAEAGLIQFVWLFSIVGAFVLFLACINFMNLSTARSEKRSKEVGIRKVMGSVRKQLVIQFFSESFIIVVLAFVVALLMVMLSLGAFNQLAGKNMSMFWTNPYFWATCLTFILITGVVSGSYPALYLSSFQPVKALKGSLQIGRGNFLPRKILVIIQFTVSVTLIIGTSTVYKQINYARDRPVGYSRDGLIMVLMNSSDYAGKTEVLRNELKNTKVVEEVALSFSPATEIWSSNGGFSWKGKAPDFQAEFATLSVTPEYGKTVGWEFITGRDFSRDLASDSSGFVVTESAAKVMNLENPIGETVKWEPGWMKGRTYQIIGVVKDMVMESPYAKPMPTVFFMSEAQNWINIKLKPGTKASEAIASIDAVFRKVVPSALADYKFADQEYDLKFISEQRIGQLALLFTVLAIFISCLGLFGLASFVAEQRTKEIGIRKVLGASVVGLWRMLSKEFVVLVMIAAGLAIPLAIYFLTNWLKRYDYRTELPWWIPVVSVVGALIITQVTVSFQAIRAARINPVKSLKSE
jgi:putative ABC transport system permease protein